ncbi:DNA methylase N-4/N-6 [actinobacterium SCGC AAA044-D11]
MKIEDMNREELVDFVKKLKSKRKLGLVWEDEKSREIFAVDAKREFPYFEEITENHISDSNSDPINFLIEGDNFFALSLLQYSHRNSIDVIYIDPPYNTGNKDFKYNDQYIDREDGYRHSKWLSFMSKRMELAKKLLKDDGIIIISIDDNEIAQLTMLSDGIFGENNRLGPFIWFYEGVNDNNAFIKKTHEYILVYKKTELIQLSKTIHDPNVSLKETISNSVVKNGTKNPISDVTLPIGFPCLREKGTISKKAVTSLSISNDFVIRDYKLEKKVIATSGWSSKDILQEFISNDCQPVRDSKGQLTTFAITNSGNINYYKVRDQSYVLSVLRNLGTVANAGAELSNMGIDFDYPKPPGLIKYLISLHGNRNGLILDFFAGSGTTGQAVLALNAEDGGSRSFILVTNNEGNICTDVCYPRIRKVMNGYLDKSGKQIDGLGGNLVYLKSLFEEKSANSDELKLRLAEKCVTLICLRENVFDEINTKSINFRVFKNQEKIVVIYNSFDLSDIKLANTYFGREDYSSKVLYGFSFDESVINFQDEMEIEDVRIEAIPQKILEILGDIHV